MRDLKRQFGRPSLWLAVVALGGVWGGVWGGARAAEWTIEPSLGVEQAYNDNVTLASRGNEVSDFVTRISPGIVIKGTGPHLLLDIDYGPDQVIFLDNGSGDEFRNKLIATGRLEVIDKLLFLDVQASIDQHLVDNRDVVTSTDLNIDVNRTTVQTYNASPSLKYRFGSWVDAETRLKIGRIISGDGQFSDVTIDRETVSFTSGTRFTALRWGLLADREFTSRSGTASNFKRLTVSGDVSYTFNSKFALLGTLGAERVKDPTLNDEPRGLFWEAGVQLNPGPRTSLRMTYGDRFETTDFGFVLSHRLNDRVRLAAGLSETVETTARLLSDDLAFIVIDALGNRIDSRTGLPFVAGDESFSLFDQSFRRKRLFVAVSGSRGRNTFDAQAFRESREIDAVGRTEVVIGTSGAWSRALSRRADLKFSLSFRNTDFDTADEREDNRLNISTAYSYRFFENLTGGVSYSLSYRDSSIDLNDLIENVLAVNARKAF